MPGEPLVEREPLGGLGDVVVGQVGGGVHRDDGIDLVLDGLPAKLPHRLLQELQVEVEADHLDLPVLLGAEQVPGPPDLHVAERDLEPRAERRQLLDHPEPLGRRLVDAAVGGDQEVGVRLEAIAAHPAAELVELREAEPVRPVDDDRVRRRDVEPRLDDGRGHEHIVRASHVIEHGSFEGRLRAAGRGPSRSARGARAAG